MEVTVLLTLTGKRDAVMALVGLAVQEGIISGLSTKPAPGSTPTREAGDGASAQPSRVKGQPMVEGDRVTVTRYNTARGISRADLGAQGTVLAVRHAGRGWSALVRLDDDREVMLSATHLRRHRRPS